MSRCAKSLGVVMRVGPSIRIPPPRAYHLPGVQISLFRNIPQENRIALFMYSRWTCNMDVYR